MIITVIDTETTGLNNSIHEVIEIAAISYEIQEDGEKKIINSINQKLKPAKFHTADAKALEVNGYTEEAWKDATDFLSIWRPLGEILDKSDILLGQNLIFDLRFIQSECKQRNLEEYDFPPYIDTKAMADQLKRAEWISSTRMDRLVEHYQIKIEGRAHTAYHDCERTFLVFEKLCRDLDNEYSIYTFSSPYRRLR